MGQYRSSFSNPLEERVDLTANTVTFTAAHVDKTIYAGGSGAQTYTLPASAVDATIEVGSKIHVCRFANQTLTVAAGADCTIVNAGASLTARARYSVITLTKIAALTWRLGGDVATS